MFVTLPREQIEEHVRYDPHKGVFVSTQSGHEVGYEDDDGYVILSINRRKLRAHRVAHLLMTGEWPNMTIDHADRNKKNNTWTNLRLATPAQQAMNSGLRINSTTGITGVYKSGSKYRAQITLQGVNKHLGIFSTVTGAKVARLKAELEHFGEFAPSLAYL